MTLLEQYGWNNFFEEHYKNIKSDLAYGRVISIQGFKYHLITLRGELEAELSGKLLYGTANEDLPKAGDWVLFMDYDSMGYIIEVLPRCNALSRKSPGEKTEKQVLAVNIDYALIVQGLDRDFNLMRLERYMVQLAACNIEPVVVLNKADLVEDPSAYKDEVLKLNRDCKVFLVSTYTGTGIEAFRNSLQRCKTYILVGSSGVGKSSILNALLNNSTQKTDSTSEVTNKGKHTTTSRDLFILPNGSLMMDTPGMREFGVTAEEGSDANELFPAIHQLADQCKFTDCSHLNETGCAVLNALGNGELNATIYESYVKLLKEQKRFSIRAEDKKRMNRQFGKMTKEAKDHRKKNKY